MLIIRQILVQQLGPQRRRDKLEDEDTRAEWPCQQAVHPSVKLTTWKPLTELG